jgi:hypothetical protein
MKNMETAIEPKDVKPVLAYALEPMKAKALQLLRVLTKRAESLPPGWEHIEDALVVQQGKSDRVASAFAKVFRRASPQAIWIEFGHRIVGHRPNRTDTGKRVVAFPFFRTALDTTRAEILKRIREGIKALLNRAASSAGLPKDE